MRITVPDSLTLEEMIRALVERGLRSPASIHGDRLGEAADDQTRQAIELASSEQYRPVRSARQRSSMRLNSPHRIAIEQAAA